MSWKLYVYGTAWLPRFHARELLRYAEAARAAGAGEDGYEKWQYERRSLAYRH